VLLDVPELDYMEVQEEVTDWRLGRRIAIVSPKLSLGLVIIAAYIEQLGKKHSPPTVKQHLAAIRMLFDWLVVGHVVRVNPASAVRGPKHVIKKGKTPVLSGSEARQLLDSIPANTLVGLRDRALIGVMVYRFARVGAVTAMNVEDYFQQGKRSGFACTRRAASFMKSQRITLPRNTLTPICGQRTLATAIPKRERRRSFEP
jgi:integrase